MNAPAKVGHPETPPEEKERITEHVCAELAKGRSLKKIFEEDGKREALCDRATFLRWRLNDITLRDKVACARADGLEAKLEEMTEIADDRKSDPDAQSRRVRIYAREREAAMLAPALYGAKMDVTSGGKPLPAPQSITVQDNRIQSILMLVQQRKEQDETVRKLLE